MADEKYIFFALGSQKYGMKLSKVKGLEELDNVVPLPVGAKYVKGIIHLRGEVVPIYDLKAHFKITDTERKDTVQLLITESHDIKMGFEADSILGIVDIPDDDAKKLPSVAQNADTKFLENVIKVKLPEHKDEDIILSIDVDYIMSDAEYQNVKDAIEENTENKQQ